MTGNSNDVAPCMHFIEALRMACESSSRVDCKVYDASIGWDKKMKNGISLLYAVDAKKRSGMSDSFEAADENPRGELTLSILFTTVAIRSSA